MDSVPAALPDSHGRCDRYLSHHLLRHRAAHWIQLLLHQRRTPRRGTESARTEVHDEDHLRHLRPLRHAVGGTEGDDGSQRRIHTGARTRTGVHVARRGMPPHRHIARNSVPQQRFDGRHRHRGCDGVEIPSDFRRPYDSLCWPVCHFLIIFHKVQHRAGGLRLCGADIPVVHVRHGGEQQQAGSAVLRVLKEMERHSHRSQRRDAPRMHDPWRHRMVYEAGGENAADIQP